MFAAIARVRARRRLETIAPNPRGRSPLRPVRRFGGVRLLGTAVLVAGVLALGALWVVRGAAPAEGPPGGAFHACGNGRWVSDPSRCR